MLALGVVLMYLLLYSWVFLWDVLLVQYEKGWIVQLKMKLDFVRVIYVSDHVVLPFVVIAWVTATS